MEGGGGMMTLPMQPMGQRFFGSNPRMMAPAGQPKHPAGRVQRGDATLGQGQMRSEAGGNQSVMFDGKRMRKAVHRKTVDYNSTVVQYLENRVWQRDFRDRRSIQPDSLYQINLVPPVAMLDNPMNCVTTKFIRTSTNKFRCPIFCLAWTPEGRRLVTGASSGEFTLWNGLTFNFETILQAHDTSVRAMQWSHNDNWMVTGDHSGFIKYWQTNMNNVKMYQGHKEPVRGISFCPTDNKFTTCSDDGTVRIWDFMKCHEEKILRGHGSDVKCVDWHPQKSLIASGSKDNQQPLKLWDPKSGTSLATIHAHKGTVMNLKWNQNGNWLLTASRDHLMKLFDIRNMKEELQTFKGHKKEATAVAWHPIHEGLFVSGGSDGAVMFWMVGTDREVGSMEEAHEGMVWSLAWHPMGHILVTGSNDHTTKFWTRNRPGDRMRDKYNLNTLPGGSEHELPEFELENPTTVTNTNIPGMGSIPNEKAASTQNNTDKENEDVNVIPGLDWGQDEQFFREHTRDMPKKKIPYARPIPWEFEQAWAVKHTGVLVPDENKDKDKDDRRDHNKGNQKKDKGYQDKNTRNLPSLLDDLPMDNNFQRNPGMQRMMGQGQFGPGGQGGHRGDGGQGMNPKGSNNFRQDGPPGMMNQGPGNNMQGGSMGMGRGAMMGQGLLGQAPGGQMKGQGAQGHRQEQMQKGGRMNQEWGQGANDNNFNRDDNFMGQGHYQNRNRDQRNSNFQDEDFYDDNSSRRYYDDENNDQNRRGGRSGNRNDNNYGGKDRRNRGNWNHDRNNDSRKFGDEDFRKEEMMDTDDRFGQQNKRSYDQGGGRNFRGRGGQDDKSSWGGYQGGGGGQRGGNNRMDGDGNYSRKRQWEDDSDSRDYNRGGGNNRFSEQQGDWNNSRDNQNSGGQWSDRRGQDFSNQRGRGGSRGSGRGSRGGFRGGRGR